MDLGLRHRAAWSLAALTLLLVVGPGRGDVTGVRGSATARVIQFTNGISVQTDFGQEIVPLTKATPPAIARARLEQLNELEEATAVGQGVTVMTEPNMALFGNPNDVGMSIGGFSDDEKTSWTIEGGATSTRTLILSIADVGGRVGLGDTGQAKSTLVLSGFLILFSQDAAADLTGNQVDFSFSLSRHQAGRESTTPLTGNMTMAGGPNGEVVFPVRAGALNTIDVPVADFPLGDEFPLVRAVIFQGVQFPFEYDFTVGESFDLELNVAAKVATTPGGVGAWALFGLPQDEIASIIDKVKKDDRGQRLTRMLAEHVDTTGAAYVNRPPVSFLPACGVLGFELAGMSVVGGFLAARRRNRRRR
ncbi:MAG TPA: hypothetical protein VJZ71_02100 [Phycisphaerae bacterium]|nr:hypothetical protein [Phycisphaerae bacterium]